jgi:hypothetical protein
LPWAKEIAKAAEVAHERLTEPVLREIVDMVPDPWFEAIPGDVRPADRRAGYIEFFTRRLEGSAVFEEEAIGAQSRLV